MPETLKTFYVNLLVNATAFLWSFKLIFAPETACNHSKPQ